MALVPNPCRASYRWFTAAPHRALHTINTRLYAKVSGYFLGTSMCSANWREVQNLSIIVCHKVGLSEGPSNGHRLVLKAISAHAWYLTPRTSNWKFRSFQVEITVERLHLSLHATQDMHVFQVPPCSSAANTRMCSRKMSCPCRGLHMLLFFCLRTNQSWISISRVNALVSTLYCKVMSWFMHASSMPLSIQTGI